jgi:hypothetical protein
VDSQHFLSHLNHSMLCLRIILNFLAEVFVVHSSSYWISTQSINVRMPQAWSVNNFEVEVLQQINPSSFPPMSV